MKELGSNCYCGCSDVTEASNTSSQGDNYRNKDVDDSDNTSESNQGENGTDCYVPDKHEDVKSIESDFDESNNFDVIIEFITKLKTRNIT